MRVHHLRKVRPVKMHHLLVWLVRVCHLHKVRPVKMHHLLVCSVRVCRLTCEDVSSSSMLSEGVLSMLGEDA